MTRKILPKKAEANSGGPIMLSRLEIENLAIIENARIEFAAGFNAVTGETGAGKTVLVGALELALGERGDAGVVREGSKFASVEAVFEGPFGVGPVKLISGEIGLEWNGTEPLILLREVSSQGRSRCFIGGQTVGVGDLKRVGELLADLHGQHEHQSLFHLAAQRAALDAFGGHGALLENYRRVHAEYARLLRRKEDLTALARDFEKRLDFLTFQIEEIGQLAPKRGELAELEAEEKRLANAETLAQSAHRAYGLLYEGIAEEGPTVVAALGEIQRDLDQIARHDAGMRELSAKLGEIRALADDLARETRRYASKCEANPERLNEVIGRIEAIRRLQRKHSVGDEEQLLKILGELRSERDRMNLDEREREDMEGRVAMTKGELIESAEKLFEARSKSAKKLAAEVGKTLAQVGMEKASFIAEVTREEEFHSEGADRVEFMLSPNPGEGSKPLREIASGGELSRVMLAIKTALAKRDAIPTLVFDEIDAGISGSVAVRVGKLLEKLAESHQVICITHQAAIAARAERHLAVRKTTRQGRTLASAVELDGENRIVELAGMMGDDGRSPAGKKLAKQLLDGAT